MLHGKKILLGVCGSIAAYKSAVLIRLLVKEGAEVRVIMTASASDFITPLTLSTLSKNPVLSEFIAGKEGIWNNHVELALWADLFVIAPASANSIAKFANGYCDNLISAIYLSARSKIILAPAMDLDMYQHPAVIANLLKLKQFGNHVLDAEHGELASGLTGTGRMAEPEYILKEVKEYFSLQQRFKGKKILITAGPTFEAIDPVRFIGNRSTGKMGFAIAEKFRDEGAKVTLISGPSSLPNPEDIKVLKVESAQEMYLQVSVLSEEQDIFIFSAAVADYRPHQVAQEKIKKKGETLELSLIKNPDIAAETGKRKKSGQIIVGFALETENEQENAVEKLRRKNFDLIVLNSLKETGAGFGTDTNKISIIDKNNKIQTFPLKAKKEVATDIINAIHSYIYA